MTNQTIRPFANLQEIVDAERGLMVADYSGGLLTIEGLTEGFLITRDLQGRRKLFSAERSASDLTWLDGDEFGVVELATEGKQ